MKTNKASKAGKYTFQQHDGLSRNVQRCLQRHIEKIGVPTEVTGYFGGRKHNPWYRVAVVGTAGRIVLTGCAWGYGGEGPQATEQLLRNLGVHPFDAIQVSRRADNRDARMADARPVWRLALPAKTEQGCQLREGQFVSTLVGGGL